jgi:hypothetical protein
MKMLVILILLTTSLISCRNRYGEERPILKDQEQLGVFLAKAVEIDGELYIPVKDSFCFSRIYHIGKDYIGPTEVAEIKLDIRECHKAIGRAPEEYLTYTTWLKDMREWLLGFE